ncbi:aldose 1-epimerase [Dinghuibacter silviterrae]|uniref:Aldose 1-epimerase n=1 Tax=Dinghuibacter silviterrae TaxID=1539049 RepID=A0A4R8DPI8_9BACT|nr:aldose 1-epimerase [Dinghuibacter silviterrae]TDX00002.1 aldose 1-epimerase [Dinghuibacter silviterrae]
MYRITEQPDSILLSGPDGTQAEIIPSCGALLNYFAIQIGGKPFNVIDAFPDPASAKGAIKPAFQSAKLSPFVCRIRDARYSYQGSLYALEKFTLNGAAIHGLLFDEDFVPVESLEGPDEASVALRFVYKGTDPGYPFTFDCLVRYTLKGASIRLDTEVLNTSHRSIPLADGWHPYFTLGKPIDELEFQFHAHEMLEFENLLPTGRRLSNTHFNRLEKIGKTELDNAFVLDKGYTGAACILRDPLTGISVEIAPDASYPILQIYTPPHRRSIAIENLSGAPDNFNNGIGLIEVQPGEVKVFSTTYTIHAGR